MVNVHGSVTFFSIDAKDLSEYHVNFEWDEVSDSHDVTTKGKKRHVFEGGLLGGTASAEGIYDNTAVTGPRAVIRPLLGKVVPLVYRPEGTGTGKPEDTVDALVLRYRESSPVADMVKWTLELQLSDDVVTIVQV